MRITRCLKTLGSTLLAVLLVSVLYVLGCAEEEATPTPTVAPIEATATETPARPTATTVPPTATATKMPTTTPTPVTTSTKFELADGLKVLDMSSELPAGFERLDAASEGMSNKDLELGPDFSEVSVFLCEDPYQVIFAYLTIIESRLERAASDAAMRDEEQIKSMVLWGLEAGAAEEGVELANTEVRVTYPDIGDLAVLGSGTISAYGISLGYDMLMFNSNKVYLFAFSTYLDEPSVSLVTVGNGMAERIGTFAQ